MGVVVITPPEPLIDLDTAKTHLRVDLADTDDDALIAAYVAAASAHIDGPGGWLGRAIGPQTLELRLSAFESARCDTIDLPYQPIIDVVSVKYLDASGVEQTLTADTYEVTEGYVLRPAYNTRWPAARERADAIRIRYRAGYAADPDADELQAAVPAPIAAAVLLMTGDLYANRETGVVGTVAADVQMSTTVEALLAPYRIWA
ncbi:head-tail connector protein [Phenylobacterium sp. J426]|uniref:head-tail connector protein n=1 Tax=Phenylobacterium sp. J426 TaxID=2898439 RepID=UPI002150C4C0|nr:head-tail connector protein [Phenylobacterium sp. J426]MCR5874369.1 head-tail connector protein [Phenylobacterium sp. J426]